MPTCPLCLHENSPDASACEHCGRYPFAENHPADAQPDSLSLQDTRLKSAPNVPRFGDPNAPPAVMTLTEMPPAPAVETPPPAAARLVVIRGMKVNAEYPLYEGPNYL